MAISTLPLVFFVASAILFADFTEGGSIGVNYGRLANNLPSPAEVVQLLKSQGINKVKLFDTDSSVLTALSNSGVAVTVTLPNELLSTIAADQSAADNWVKANVSQFYPATKIEAIAIGNEVFVDPANTTKFLVPAMKNIHASLVSHKLDSSIKVSSPVALSALQSSYPPSSGSFKPDLIELAIKPMLDFLRQTGSYIMVNAYPFFAYAANSNQISLDYALFRENPGSVDSGNGLKYVSLFDAQIDAVFAAMSALQYNDVKMVVTETGWPSAGDENEVGASQENAAAYNGNLVRRVLTGNGTPLRPHDPLNVYLFALFNENQKPGPTSERNYGLFYPNKQRVYGIPLMMSAPVNDSKTKVPPTAEPPNAGAPTTGGPTSSAGQSWCVANGKAKKEKLQAGLDYACGEGGADCRPIQKGSTCFNPNSLVAHASYAYNSFYQKNTRAAGTCDFGGTAYVVSQPPRFEEGKCEFPTGY